MSPLLMLWTAPPPALCEIVWGGGGGTMRRTVVSKRLSDLRKSGERRRALMPAQLRHHVRVDNFVAEFFEFMKQAGEVGDHRVNWPANSTRALIFCSAITLATACLGQASRSAGLMSFALRSVGIGSGFGFFNSASAAACSSASFRERVSSFNPVYVNKPRR
jgi:hypothetical protein